MLSLIRIVRRWLGLVFAAGLILASQERLFCSQTRLTVDSGTSTLAVELCVLGTCDTQTSALGGFLVAALDDNATPGSIALRNFDLQATSDYTFHLNYGFLGNIVAHARSLRIYHASPGAAQPFFPIAAGQYTILNVPYRTSGTADYTASGGICSLIQAQGRPCSTNLDLSTLGQNTIDQLLGTIQVSNGVVRIHLDFSFTSPLDPMNPDLGTISGHAVVNAAAPLSTGLVPPGSDWRYLDTGVEPNIAWRGLGFDDSAWGLGPAQLGYGDGDESTVVGYGPAPADKYITTWFRHSFNVPNPAMYTNLALRVLRDDAAIVYLNGVEVYHDRYLPAGAVTASTLATKQMGGFEESIFEIGPPVDPALLHTGANVLAVEVHQGSPESSDISFDLELIGNGVFTNAPPMISLSSPTNSTIVSNNTVTIAGMASDSDGIIDLLEFFVGEVRVGQFFSTGTNFNFQWHNACAGTYAITVKATDNGGAAIVSAPVMITVARPPVTLITPGSAWKYLDNGSDPGIAWRTNTFNDSSWLSGGAQLGFGDGDETTVINGGPATNRFVTTYFRRAFSAANVGAIGGLTLHLLRDDGAVVYLNGTEVYRNNLPGGIITNTTLALTNAAPAEETNFFFTASINPALLQNGANNLIAVEVHQAATNSTDLSFDFSLDASYTNTPPSVAMTSPADNASFPLGASIPLQVATSDLEGTVRSVEYYEGTNRIIQLSGPNFNWAWNFATPGVHLLTARALDDCDAQTVSAPITVRVGSTTLANTGAVWKYLDDGSDQGTGWRLPGFNDASWASGPAQLGFGDGDEATVINGGPASSRYITTYFRRTFLTPNAHQIQGLYARVLRDDGVVVYLNGVEIFRSNMPLGPVSASTVARTAVGGNDENTYYLIPIDASALVSGTNLLAAELHQSGPTSSDLSFDLELIGVDSPALQISAVPGGYQLRWSTFSAGYNLFKATNLSPPISWRPVSGTPADDGLWKTLVVPNTGTAGFYRLSTE